MHKIAAVFLGLLFVAGSLQGRGDPPIDIGDIVVTPDVVYARKCGMALTLISIPGTGHEFSGQDGYHAQHGERANIEMAAWFVGHLGRK